MRVFRILSKEVAIKFKIMSKEPPLSHWMWPYGLMMKLQVSYIVFKRIHQVFKKVFSFYSSPSIQLWNRIEVLYKNACFKGVSLRNPLQNLKDTNPRNHFYNVIAFLLYSQHIFLALTRMFRRFHCMIDFFNDIWCLLKHSLMKS